jgi:hypothetical protein
MKHTFAIVLALQLIGAAAAAQVGSLPDPRNAGSAPPPPGTSTLRGHVFAADSGLPLRKAQVRIVSAEGRENRLATTDNQGAYEFKELRAGRYNISASKGSYVSLSYGQQRPTEPAKPLAILDNQVVERMDFTLPRGAVIMGRVVDEFGEPISDVQVGVQQYQFVQGQRRLVPTARQGSTNDIGEFRLFGMSPGQYYLVATWRPQNPMNSEDTTAYAPMYFPGTDNVAQAQRVTVAAGQEISDIVMALKPMRATRVSGTATTAEGKPMAGAVMAMSTGGFGFSMAGNAPIRPDGTFSLTGLAPGEYSLRAQAFGPGGPGEMAVTTITVTGEDITGVRLVSSKPSALTGRIVTEPAAASALPASLQLVLLPMDFGVIPMGMGPAAMGGDGTFEMKSGPGKMRITMFNAGGWTIRSVRLNGTDITDAGVDIKPGEDVSGLEIELTNKLTAISGLVTNARGQAVKDYSAIVFSQDRDKWKTFNRYQGTGRPDQDGRFKISGLPPGDYYIVAVDKIEQGQSSDPDFLEAIRTKATALTIHEGETRTVDLKVTTAS